MSKVKQLITHVVDATRSLASRLGCVGIVVGGFGGLLLADGGVSSIIGLLLGGLVGREFDRGVVPPVTHDDDQTYTRGKTGTAPHFGSLLEADYRILGLSVQASSQEVKQAYRRMISQCHPDKLIGQDATDERIVAAKEKAQRLTAAYERIQKEHNANNVPV